MSYQVMPPLTEDERADLEQSIKANGVLVPVLIDDGGDIIDGHHRAEIADRLGIEYLQITKVGTPAELRTLAYSLNLHRRHLSREQKRELVETSLKADPQLSDREHSRRTSVSPTTAAKVRSDLEESDQLDTFSTRVDPRTGNVSQSATQPPRPAAGLSRSPALSTLYAQPQTPAEKAEADEREAEKARAEALTARVDLLDRAVDFLTEFAEWPDRVDELRDAYTPLYPTNGITGDKLRLAVDGLNAVRKAWA